MHFFTLKTNNANGHFSSHLFCNYIIVGKVPLGFERFEFSLATALYTANKLTYLGITTTNKYNDKCWCM